VATVVGKLFTQVRPDVACFGEKDFQQLAVVRRMATDLDLGVEVVGVPTMRDTDGLALSSRNAYLTTPERTAAVALPQALAKVADGVRQGELVEVALAAAKAALLSGGFDSVDYVALCDPDSLESLSRLDRPARLLAAAKIGRTRLIDNIAVNP